MIEIKNLDKRIRKVFNAEIKEILVVGSGISGNVFKVNINMPPYVLAVKTAKDGNLLKKECEYIKFIYNKVDIKLPKIYDINIEDNNSYMLMQYFDGIPCSDVAVLNSTEEIRRNISVEIADNIAKLQKIHCNKYGELLNPQFSDWHAYYKPFVIDILNKASLLIEEGILEKSILDTMNLAFKNYDKIFDEPISKPTLIHGDYWASNIIVDRQFHLIGVVDPFNALWADNEYELFALNAVYGDKLPVLDEFLKKYPVSKKFGVKNEFYFLFSEVYWVTIMKHDNNNYLKEIADRFIKQLKNI